MSAGTNGAKRPPVARDVPAWVWREPLAVQCELADWYLVFQNLCVALKHPLNRGSTRGVMVRFARQLGFTLLSRKVMTRDELEHHFRNGGFTGDADVDRDESVSHCDTCQQVLIGDATTEEVH